MTKKPSLPFITLALGLLACLILVACDEGKGTSPAVSYLNPSISDLTVSGNTITNTDGGILTLTCGWTNPDAVYSAAAYLAYSTTLTDTSNGPTGVLASGTATAAARIGTAIRSGFQQEFATPLVIPTAISSTDVEGYWSVQIPFPASVTADAPIGKSQMLLWMVFNNRKSNTLAFEIEFVASGTSSAAANLRPD